MTTPHTIDSKGIGTRLISAAQRWLGARVVTTALVLFIVGSATLDVLGKTTTAWSYIRLALTEKTSLLNTAELEVLDEWVVLIDSAESFLQAEVYRQHLTDATKSFSDKEAAEHFSRNLRVVRDASSPGYWILVADITGGQGSLRELEVTIDCLRSQVASWEADDIVSPWFRNARPIRYSLTDFNRTYGRATNVPSGHSARVRVAEAAGVSKCAYPYGGKG